MWFYTSQLVNIYESEVKMKTKFLNDGFEIHHKNLVVIFTEYGEECSWDILRKRNGVLYSTDYKVVPYKGTDHKILAEKAKKRIAEIA